jgi:large subunit ribosomal protein L34e
MVKRALRSRSLRHVRVRTPGSRVVIHHEKRKPKIAHCAKCGAILKGVPRARPFKMHNLPKTKKRPERPFGGMLCSACSRSIFKEKAKSLG